MNIIYILHSIITKILYGSEENRHKYKELKTLELDLKKTEPQLYHYRTNKLTKDFAVIINNMKTAVLPLAELMRKTLNSNDKTTSYKAEESIIFSKLTKEEINKINKLKFSEIKDRILNAQSIKDEIRNIENELNSYLSIFSEQRFKTINSSINSLRNLGDLGSYDFEGILAPFSKTKEIILESDSYQSTDAGILTEVLLDLYYIISNIKIDQELASNLMILSSSLEENQNIQKKHIESLRALNKTLFIISDENLKKIIKLIKKEPDLEPAKDFSNSFSIDKYTADIIESFKLNTEKILQEKRNYDLQSKIEELFGDIELINIKSYNKSISEQLEEKSLPGLKYLKASEIYKSFLLAVYQQSIKDNFNTLLVDSFFEDTEFKNNFSDVLYKTEELIPEITSFEEDLNSVASEYSIENIRKMIEKADKSNPLDINSTNSVANINEKVRVIVERGSNSLFELFEILESVLNDYKTNPPVYISNIRTIKGTGNREFITSLFKNHKELKLFIDIMKNYIIINKKNIKKE